MQHQASLLSEASKSWPSSMNARVQKSRPPTSRRYSPENAFLLRKELDFGEKRAFSRFHVNL